MMYAPRAIRHFSLAAMEGRAERAPVTPRTLSRPIPPPVPMKEAPAQGARRAKRVVVRLWLPTTLIFLLLAPFALLLAPLLYFAPRPYGDRPWATVLAVGHVLLSLGGTVVEVEAPDVLVHIRTF